jgi:hypothetical protein
MTCSLANLGTCLPEMFFNFVLSILNAPLQNYLTLVQTFLAEPPAISLFLGLWTVIIYIISMFYGLLLVYSGINLMVSGYSPQKREEAKSWLKNIIIMIFLVQASYLIYGLILDINTALTTSIFNLIDPNTFLLNIGNFINFGSSIIETFLFLNILQLTMFILVIRYLVVAFGVVLFPIGIFLYFIIPLRRYGRAIIKFILLSVFASFFASLILLAGSLIIPQNIFAGTNYLALAAIFLCMDILLVYLLVHSILSMRKIKQTTTTVVKTVAVAAA